MPEGFLHEIVDRSTVVEERVEACVLSCAERQGEQAQTGGPAFRPLEERLEERRVQVELECLEKGARLVGREGELGGAQLDQLAVRAKDVHGERRVVPGREDEAEIGRRRAQELLDPVRDTAARQVVEVVDHDRHRRPQLRDDVQEPIDETRRRPRTWRGES